MGGFRVVYEYANQLVARGHSVSIVHPRRAQDAQAEKLTILQKLRKTPRRVRNLFFKPMIGWQRIDPRVDVRFVPVSSGRYIPDGDALFATTSQTVQAVLKCSSAKGQKCYLIQGYEIWMAEKSAVDRTWRADLRKVVVSHWLMEIGEGLGCSDLTHIPVGIDHEKYRVLRPIENRPRRVTGLFSTVSVKGSADGIAALKIAKEKYPDLEATLFGTDRRQSWIPSWITCLRDPPQDRIVKDLYNNSSILLSSSLSEGFPLPPVEGAACGCAVVTTDSGGVRDFVEHEVSGLMSPAGKPEALAANLCHLLENDELRVRLAKGASQRALEFTWERSADLLESFLNQEGRAPAEPGRSG